MLQFRLCKVKIQYVEGDTFLMEPTGRRKVLITGGAGFLGINLIRHLMEKGYALASLDVEEFD